ncbi:hypothetical protein SISSUDRAFT_983756 [Sistotremastrum suecicum HHB10207 ss-3]|uniref:Sec7-domain-containing protein n=1 Tax=Sistotremastrum suecicum HHB10207 ss-3 TaxID=1314776 RepID=A0A166EXR9_9AGAM|nr:hypothetical protein SISSUDRAFT_983756 [Sistotremastrum suecicum HHB10207 ss-3]
MQAVSKSEIAGVLARSGGAFHASALQCYIDRFEFNGDPLDVALRKLLMDVGLPKETQQIDRVMEAFAKRYTNCNPGLFISEDQPYVLAFSLMMLHTDAFNKSNKRKMTKVDYIKNTRLPGLAQEILDCFFDNIVFAPFIFIEDPTDVNGQRGIVPEGGSSSRIIPSISGLSASGNNSSTSIIGKANKIDPYYLITRNLLGSLRVDVDAHISPFDPYLPDGTLGPRNEVELRKAFARADVIEVSEPRRSSVPFLGNGSTGSSVAVNTSATSLHSPVENTSQSNEETWTLKVTKCGLLNRKEDVSEGGKRATARKWREWSVILTGSQLLFFRDPNWATTLLAQAGSPNGQVLFPHTTLLKPDELLSVNDSIALYDVSYTKYSNTLRFVMANGRQFLLQAGSEVEMNDWIHKINYASTFRTVGVRIRSLALSSEDVKMTGVAAAASHMQDRSMPRPPAQTLRSWTSQDHIGQDSPPKQRHPRTADDVERPPTLTRKLSMIRTKVPLEKSDPVDSQDSEQLKATFDQVKATLAENASKLSEPRYRAMSFADSLSSAGLSDSVQSQSHWSDDATVGQHSSRSSVIRTKILELESKITTLRSQLESDVRLSLNLALLTPFQKSTRDRIEATAIALGKKIQLHRLELAKLGCHHSILLEDLQSANSEWQCVKKGALRAANNALENNLNSPIPRMKISVAATESPGLGLSPLSVDTADRADSSVCDSFYSAVETLDAESNLGGSPLAAEEPGTPGSSSFRSVLPHGSSDAPSDHGTSPNLAVPSSNLGRSGSLHIPPPSPSTTPTSLPRTSEEKAEEWNETRAAKRVSLVRLPSQLKLSTALGKSSRTQA